MTDPIGAAAAVETHGAPRPLAVSSVAAYRRDWQLFTDWCAATSRQALPASSGTVTGFLDSATASPSTARRLRAAIADAHRRAGHVPPAIPAASRPHPFLGVDVEAVLGRIPVWGWPAGLFGRRDAMLVVVRVQAGLTLAQTTALTVEQVAVDHDCALRLPGGQLPATDDPRVCPACVWLRWRSMLLHMRRFTPAAVLARRLHRPDVVDEHRCIRTPTQEVTGPVLVPINQWGAPPLPLQPATTRTITTLTTAHTRNAPPRHQARTPPPEEQPPTLPAASPTVEAPKDARTSAQALAEGIAARQRGYQALAAVASDFDDLDVAANELQQRLDELLSQAGHDLEHVREIRRS